jgi:hypothetical protein
MSTQERMVNVRLLVFSGRPDPEWTLSPEAVDALASRVKKAVGSQEIPAPPPPVLGYRGFLVRGGTLAGLPPEFTVFRRVVTVPRGRGEAQHWMDTSGVEDLLLQEARRDHDTLLGQLGVQGGRGGQPPQQPSPDYSPGA